ncbi:DNA helicase PcrA [Lacrimispora sp.]|jgi:DNA helicase-2/ATP-dependent DNA helicase PcrA|uniref:DNA helicase PcrA n=1 Tax=Lacrimispora sp. TaxID=2719234 RepID=UPI00289E7755|nr:DNA helicase PcrA [Lacrimispora sp.]
MSIYDTLNPMQKEAVLHTEGPLLVLAGAGSGKTRVLTHRIAYLIEEKNINPWNILAITFTNKAAGEMRERVDRLVGFGADSIWVSTFHSSCVRILRRHIESLGYSTNFTIYDSDDQKTLMRHVLKGLDMDPKIYKDRAMLGFISTAKNELVTAQEFELNAGGDFRQKKVAQIYKEYQSQLKKNNALDFDDLIMKTVQLFQNNPEVVDYYQERFKYIMVDEYQDTNTAQFKLISLLAGKYRNLCVVGDDDQSIYKFRGANVENILNFEKAYPGARVIKLEQNYRSSQSILNAANEVIRHNRGRKDKTLWTANEEGPLVQFKQFENAPEEADAIVRDILNSSSDYQDCAVLYRTNAQSRLIEEKCLQHNVPYRMVGGVNFYQRKEIKDILSYLKTIANAQDDLASLRIINVPKRGIGATSLGKVQAFASEHGFSIYDAFCRAKAVPGLGKTAEKVLKFTEQIEDFRGRLEEETYSIHELIEDVLDETGYQKELEAEGEIEYQTRLENIEELINKAVSFEGEHEQPNLSEFLEEVALVADVDRMDDSENRVTLMTLHSAKGLEFPRVYLSGMEDGLFPSMMSISSDDKEDVEEERRLCYVGITRAQNFLMMTAARQRMVNGETRYSKVSRFIDEIPDGLLDSSKLESRLSAARTLDYDDSGLPWGKAKSAGRTAGVSSFGPGNNAYASKTAAPASTPGFGKAFTVEKAASLNYKEGDRVSHVKFGEGEVLEIKDGGRDFEVTVRFDQAGIKKMFASFAKLKLVRV